MTTIVARATDGTLTTSSLIIAEGTGHEHRAVLKVIRENLADFEDFGRVALEVQPFETAGGVQRRDVAILNEEHATLLLTYMRNIGKVKDFKKALVREFWQMKRGAEIVPATELTDDELMLRALTVASERVAALTARAEVAERQVIEAAPKVEMADRYLNSAPNGRLVREVAKLLFVTESWLRAFLLSEGLIFARHAPCGVKFYDFKSDFKPHFEPREHVVMHRAGPCSHYTLTVTPRGVDLIRKRLLAAGHLAIA